MKISSGNLFSTLMTILALLFECPSAFSLIIPDFGRYRHACPSSNVNAWKFKIRGLCYLVTPAHVAIYPGKDGTWTFSNFLDDFKDMDWRIRFPYCVTRSPQDDICWARYHGDDTGALELEDSDIVDPTKAFVIFRQPYDMDAVRVSNGAELGLTVATVYKTANVAVAVDNNDVIDNRPLLESMDVGFRGMSGAIAVNEKGNCVGMFVKRGKLIALKPPRLAESDDTAAESVVPETVPVAEPSWFEKVMFPSIARMDAQFSQLNAKVDRLTEVVLKKEDLHELGVVFDARRGLFLPSTNMLSINDEMSISVKSVLGSKAPEMPRF